MNDSVLSASRVLELLEYLAGTAEGASLTQARTALGLPKSSTLMLLRTLLARGYVSKDPADRYRLNETFRSHGFGWGGHRFARLIALAEPVMRELCERVDETVILGALENESVKLLAKTVSAQDIRYDADLTKLSPAYCTAMGRILLAFAPEDRREAILQRSKPAKLTPSTVTDLDQLRTLVRMAAVEGFAIVEEEFALGGTGVAAPVFGRDGAIAAALDVGCVTPRFRKKRDQILAALLEAAQTLSVLLAHQTEAERSGESLSAKH